jgi:hypothetical protein
MLVKTVRNAFICRSLSLTAVSRRTAAKPWFARVDDLCRERELL